MLTTLLDLVCWLALILFGFLVWPPLALLAFAVGGLLVSRGMSR